MSGVLVVAETRRRELRDISVELITAGAQIKVPAGDRLTVAVIADQPDAYVDRLRAVGVDEVLTVATPAEHFDAQVAARAVEALIAQEKPAVVLVGHTIDGMGFAPAVAARSRLGFASDVTRLAWSDGPIATRRAYGGKLEAELDFQGHDCTLLTLRPGSFEPAKAGGDAGARTVEVEHAEPAATEHIRYETREAEELDINQAAFLLSIGRGVQAEGTVERFAQLAERMGATLCGSRPLIDAGWIPSTRGVGQSGKTVKPNVYLALGISGSVQHLAGLRGAETIIAINRDPRAPIFEVAQYGAVADVFAIVEQLEQRPVRS